VSSCTEKVENCSLFYILKSSLFCKETFLNGTRAQKFSRAGMHAPGGAGVGCWLLQKCNLVNLPIFLNLTRQFACKFQVNTFFHLQN